MPYQALAAWEVAGHDGPVLDNDRLCQKGEQLVGDCSLGPQLRDVANDYGQRLETAKAGQEQTHK